jgi:hypothetical protein
MSREIDLTKARAVNVYDVKFAREAWQDAKRAAEAGDQQAAEKEAALYDNYRNLEAEFNKEWKR